MASTRSVTKSHASDLETQSESTEIDVPKDDDHVKTNTKNGEETLIDSENLSISSLSPHNNKKGNNKVWLVLGDGDLSYSSTIAKDLARSKIELVATVLEEESVHKQVYEKSTRNVEMILSSHPLHQVKFGIDATNLKSSFFPDADANAGCDDDGDDYLKFDFIEFNFPHWRGKTNARHNRELLDNFLKSATRVLKKSSGEIRVALCDGQGGMPADSLEGWKQSWMAAMYAAKHGLMLKHIEPYHKPTYDLSSHRGMDRPFFLGKRPQRYTFAFPDGNNNNPVDEDYQISCRHELRVMLHPEKLGKSPQTFEDIVDGDAVFDLGQEFIPEGIRFEIPARVLLTPKELKGGHVPLAVFLLNYSGESKPLTRASADLIRTKIEAAIIDKWKLNIAKGGRLVSRPFPYKLLPKLIKEYKR